MSHPVPPKYPEQIVPRPGLLALARLPIGSLVPPPEPGCGYQSRDLLEMKTRGYVVQAHRSLNGMWFHRVKNQVTL